ncbi:E3 ubiquitin-protein ligase TTC3 isoform X3 [Scyliorhinus canicula]|uniref:E3 ubiquitin-protein ligase TTC3 isoform X3 n=1 Tax=Scyliorhinus canicula TaxID=7830 RepID=UPI0018F46D78|nr:E3 ubiquitin-protein ligase TTC3 isoform X3 [Scyliorhinus canicula]
MDDSSSDSEDSKLVYHQNSFLNEPIFERDSQVKPKNNMDGAEMWHSDNAKNNPMFCKRRHVISIHILWPFLFAQKNMVDRFLEWAFAARFIDAENYDVFEIDVMKLQSIELLEVVLEAIGKHNHSTKFLSCLLDLWDKVDGFNCDLDDAIDMIEKTGEFNSLRGEVSSGTKRSRMAAIAISVFQYAYFVKMYLNCENIPNLIPKREDQKSEEYRNRGNDEFKNENYEAAVNWYSKAIDLRPDNELLYGNRALCLLRIENYMKALGDGKRAIVLKPNWPKGHYRLCDALFSLGEHKRAIAANTKAQQLCKDVPDGIRDLIQQKERFLKKQRDENRGRTRTDGLKEELNIKKEHSKLPTKPLCESYKSDSNRNQERNGLKTRLSQYPEKTLMPVNDSDNIMSKLKSLIHDGYIALLDKRAHNAKNAFIKLLNLVDHEKLEELSLSTNDYVIIIYGHACALLGIGLPEELTEAENQFNKILEQFPKQRLDCLAFYGLGKVYFRQNRFADALDPFTKSLTMVNRKIVPGILTWPTTTVVIEETQDEKLKTMLEEYIGKCRFPPESDAICRYPHCQGHSKIQIYFSDPDFKGFIQVQCYLQCHVEYHINCWKKLKATSFEDKNDKDFLRGPCFTPDCGGQISKIIIFNSKGLMKCEFEAKIVKSKDPSKTVVKQKCSSVSKLMIKEDRKQARKQFRKEASRHKAEKQMKEKVERNNSLEEATSKSGHSWDPLGDRMLQLITENKEQIKTGVKNVSNLLQELLSFHVLSEQDYDRLCTGASKPCQVMGQLLDLIVQKNNRIKTREFLYTLSKCDDVDNKLLDWINWLNDAGREAAYLFLSRYSNCLEQLDLSSLLELLDASRIDLPMSDSSKEIVEQLKQESPTKTRSFIWMLEEKREQFPSLQNPLDEYFNAMDAPCTVLKKQENEELSITGLKSKIRNRKKKPKDSKPFLLLSGTVGTGTRGEEDDEIFSDDGILAQMNSAVPFTIPEYLRGQLEDFDDIYDPQKCGNHYQRVLDNHPDPTRESLYDYFAQILNEHGPMEIDDPMLVGEFENFPPEAQELVRNAGGLKSFLMESLRFVMINSLIGLMKHAVQLKNLPLNENPATRGTVESENNSDEVSSESLRPVAHLNPTAKEFKPVSLHQSFLSCPSVTTSLSEIQNLNQHLHYDAELGINISTDNMYTNSNLYSDESIPDSQSSNIGSLDHNVEANDPLADHHLSAVASASQSSSAFNPTLCNDVLSSPMHSDIEQGRPVFSNLPITNYNYQFQSLNSHGGCNPMTNKMENMTLSSTSANTIVMDTLEEIPLSDFKPEDANGASSKLSSKVSDNTSSNKCGNKRGPLLRTIAVQAHRESLSNAKINTDPFQPFEKQQGDILRIEKEHNVLQKQLQEAEEKYDQLAVRSTNEIAALEEKMSAFIKKNELLKSELDLLRQDLESEIKKSQQEKRENNENLKIPKSKVKSLADLNVMYTEHIQANEQLYEKRSQEFEELSNQSSREKKRVEDAIKKSVDVYQETKKRANDAEVSALESWRNTQLFFHYRAAEDAKGFLDKMKATAASSSISAMPQLQILIATWESFLFAINQQIRQTEIQFHNQMTLVKDGTQLNSLPLVTIPSLPALPNSNMILENGSFVDPAIIASFPSASEISSIPQAGTTPKPLPSLMQAALGTAKVTSKAPSVTSSFQNQSSANQIQHKASLAKHQSAWLPINNKSAKSSVPELANSAVIQPPASRPVITTSQQPKNSFDKIINRLSTMFPHYSRVYLTNFIKEVRSANGGSLSGLVYDEIINRVAELILDRQDKTRTFDGEPCIICHEDLTQDTMRVLDCKHHFHKLCIEQWLRENSTCPTCRVHALLSEDFPDLTK